MVDRAFIYPNEKPIFRTGNNQPIKRPIVQLNRINWAPIDQAAHENRYCIYHNFPQTIDTVHSTGKIDGRQHRPVVLKQSLQCRVFLNWSLAPKRWQSSGERAISSCENKMRKIRSQDNKCTRICVYWGFSIQGSRTIYVCIVRWTLEMFFFYINFILTFNCVLWQYISFRESVYFRGLIYDFFCVRNKSCADIL